MFKELLPAAKMTIVLATMTGIIFPLAITAVSQLVFPAQANGSLVKNKDGKIIGSKLIGQKFQSAKYFHPRPSAAGSGYAGEASGGTNLGPTSAKLLNGTPDDPATKADETFLGIKQLAEAYRAENELAANAPVPVDAVTRSGSGLDPDISQSNALLQAPRIAKARGIELEQVNNLIAQNKTDRDLGIFGEPRTNVLLLNLDLDKI